MTTRLLEYKNEWKRRHPSDRGTATLVQTPPPPRPHKSPLAEALASSGDIGNGSSSYKLHEVLLDLTCYEYQPLVRAALSLLARPRHFKSGCNPMASRLQPF